MIDFPDDVFDEPSGPSDAAEELDRMSAARIKVRRRPWTGVSAGVRGRYEYEVEERRTSGDWSGACSNHLVALYAWLHERVYGVASEVMADGIEFSSASTLANRMMLRDFAGDVVACVEFTRWAWRREQGREAWRRENRKDGSRLGWRFFFKPGGPLVVEYRIDLARKGYSEKA